MAHHGFKRQWVLHDLWEHLFIGMWAFTQERLWLVMMV